MRLGNEARVGLIVFVAFIALISIYWFLGGFGLRSATYPIYAIFDNVQKLDKGADVRMAGVKIGIISNVRLTRSSKARVDMLIDNGNTIPEDSQARITSGALIGDNFLEIVPGSSRAALKPDQKVSSKDTVQFDQIMSQVSGLLTDLKTITGSIKTFMGDPEMAAALKNTLKGLEESTMQAAEMLASAKKIVEQSGPKVDKVFGDLAKATNNAILISKDIDKMITQDVRPNTKSIMEQANQATKGLNESIAQAKDMIATFNESAGKITSTLDKVDTTVSQANEMMTNLKDASAGIKELATDEELKANLRTTFKNAAEASTEAKTLVTNLSKKFTGVQSTPSAKVRASIPDYGLSGSSVWDLNTGKLIAGTNYTFAFNDKQFYRVGVFDLGENTEINLQGGELLSPQSSFRYGLFASKLGAGYDYFFTPQFRISTDLYRPNDPVLTLHALLNVGGPIWLDGGALNLLGGRNKGALLGIHYNQLY